MRRLLLTVALAVLPLASAAGPGGEDIVSIRLEPESRALSGKNASQQYIVIAKTAADREWDVTDQAQFSLTNPDLAVFKELGQGVTVRDGETKVQASVGSHAAEAIVIPGVWRVKTWD